MAQIIPASTDQSQETRPDNAAWFRYGLGQYPTRVTLIQPPRRVMTNRRE